jgi:hypothetical protein
MKKLINTPAGEAELTSDVDIDTNIVLAMLTGEISVEQANEMKIPYFTITYNGE